MNEKELAGILLDTVSSIPSMNGVVKLDTKITPKDVLLLSNLINKGIESKGNGLLDAVPADAAERLTSMVNEWLKRVELSELYDKLRALTAK